MLPGRRRVSGRPRAMASLRGVGLRAASSRSSGRSAGIRRSRSPRSRCRTSCAGSRRSCAGRTRSPRPPRGALVHVRPAGRGGPPGPAARWAAAAARCVAAHVRRRSWRATATRRSIFASAPSQNEFLAALRADPSIPWPRLTAFHLDEYVGIGARPPGVLPALPQGPALRPRAGGRLPRPRRQGGGPRAPSARATPISCGGRLRAWPSSGIGENGHLAFIDPPMCDFLDPDEVRVVELDEACRAPAGARRRVRAPRGRARASACRSPSLAC